MFDPDTLKTIAQIGGWVFCGVMLAGVGYFLLRAFARGDLVPGSVHSRVLNQNDKLAETLGRLASAVEGLTGQTVTSIGELREDFRELRQTVSPRRD